MKQLVVGGLLSMLVFLSLGGRAHAQVIAAPDHPGVDLGVRLGYAVPFGDIDGDPGDGLASTFSGAIPFVLEAGYRLTPSFSLGALFQYAIAQVKDTTFCGNGVSCSGSIVRLGVQGIYHIPVEALLTPWVGLGIGYEWMSVDVSGGGASGSFGAHGFEFLTLHAGADYRLAPQFSIGPFASLSVSRYATVSADSGGSSTSSDIGNPAIHEWLQLGVRGTFSL